MRVYNGFPIILVFVWLIFVLLCLSSKVFLALCIYNDSKYRRDKNAALWAILSGVYFITAIVYLVIRTSSKNNPHRCELCGAYMAPNGVYCPYCGRIQHFESPENIEKFDRSRKLFLGMWVGSLILSIASFVFYMVFLFNFAIGVSH